MSKVCQTLFILPLTKLRRRGKWCSMDNFFVYGALFLVIGCFLALLAYAAAIEAASKKITVNTTIAGDPKVEKKFTITSLVYAVASLIATFGSVSLFIAGLFLLEFDGFATNPVPTMLILAALCLVASCLIVRNLLARGKRRAMAKK